MSMHRLCILASLLGCCVGYLTAKRPASFYGYQKKSYVPQWQPAEYKAYDYYSYDYLPYDYQSYDYHPYDYHRYDYQPSYYGSYYYYYPISYEYPKPHKHDLKPRLPYKEGQKLLQLYRLIRVIELFRAPPKPKKRTSLDKLIHQLSDPALQKQLVALLHHVHGYKEVAQLERGHEATNLKLFVNDNARLLKAIQRALNALHLDHNDDHYHRQDHHYNPHGHRYTRLPKHLRQELRHLRDQANALTVAQIERELKKGYKVQGKEGMDNLDAEGEAKSLVENYDVMVESKNGEDLLDLDNGDQYLLVIDDTQEEPLSRDDQIDEEALDDLAAALELYLEDQKVAQAQQAKEKSPEEEVRALPTTTTTTTTPASAVIKEAAQESWLGSLLGKGNLLPGHQAAPVEPESKNNKQDQQNKWVQEEVVNKNTLDFDIDPRLQTSTSTERTISVPAVTHSVPIWLTQKPELQKIDNKESRIEVLTETKEEVQPELPESRQEAEDVAEDATDDEARELPDDELNPQLVEEEVDGPARFDLPTDLNDRVKKESSPETTTPADENPENAQLQE